VVKKTEDSEWSRFSRVLGNQPRPADEMPAKEQQAEPAPAPREAAQPAPVSTPAVARPAVAQTFVRPLQPAPVVQETSDEIETVIGVHSFFDGTFRCESSMRIKGTVQGEIACNKSLVIEETAKVSAKVTSANATIAGKLDGSVTCDGRLEVLATGRVTGELTAAVLIIQEGAFFEGHLKMKERKVEEAPSPEVQPDGANPDVDQ
jgi:cytoskeletal protein CcmA (bactofilin family)